MVIRVLKVGNFLGFSELLLTVFLGATKLISFGNFNLMENSPILPPGFRFHPTDEELITHYLSKKVADSSFCAIAIGEVDMNKIEPWDLPWKAKLGEKEWYFFCVRDKKYPTGLRTNRATPSGFWKATGKDKKIFRGKTLVGMKKTLVFYEGRAPKGEKSNWISHEYRLEGSFILDNLPNASKNDWVISRVFQKTSSGKKVHISGLVRTNSAGNELPEPSHVHCFSSTPVPGPPNIQDTSITRFNDPMDSFPATPAFPWRQLPSSIQPGIGFQFPGSVPLQDPSVLRTFLASYGQNLDPGFGKQWNIASASPETALSTENSSVVSNVEVGRKLFEAQEAPRVGPQDLEYCIWSY